MDPFIGEIRAFPYGFTPRSWAPCEGQLLPISQNTALFSLLGTTYGGDGKSTFALPDFRGRVAIGPGAGPGLSERMLGESGGQSAVTLASTEMPAHTHALMANGTLANRTSPAANSFARVTGAQPYAPGNSAPAAMAPLPNAGNSAPHNNLQPYLTMGYFIALQGSFPRRP